MKNIPHIVALDHRLNMPFMIIYFTMKSEVGTIWGKTWSLIHMEEAHIAYSRSQQYKDEMYSFFT